MKTCLFCFSHTPNRGLLHLMVEFLASGFHSEPLSFYNWGKLLSMDTNWIYLKVECLLTSAIWSYGHEAEVYIFLNLPFPSNPKENFSIRCILSTPEQNLL